MVMASDERVVIVAYDIADRRRWRRVFKAMNGYGEWLQLSVFQCRLSPRRVKEMETTLRGLIKVGEDHVLLLDVGLADAARVGITSLGKSFAPLERRAIVI
jgi:CRISPR-associated protein Cas2